MEESGHRLGSPQFDATEYDQRRFTVSVNVPVVLRGPAVLCTDHGIGQVAIDDRDDGVLIAGRPVYIPRPCTVRISAIFDAKVCVSATLLEGLPTVDLASPVVTDLRGNVGVYPDFETNRDDSRVSQTYVRNLEQSLAALLRGLPGRNHSNKLSLFNRLLPQLLSCDLFCCHDVSNAQLAAMASMSTHHFGRVFQATFGVGPADYRRFVRLRAAEDLVRFTTASTAEIAFTVGYKDRTSFSRAFSQSTGVTPEQVRSGADKRSCVAGNARESRRIHSGDATRY